MNAVYQVFPAGGLDQSIVLAVLIGVWVTLLFTETLGWVFVGLVVPGYLASVLVVQPTAAAIIVAEGLATYVLARGLAYGLAPTKVWQPFFGRDRFFLIVVVLVPFGIGPDTAVLRPVAPGVLWVAALLAALLSISS